MTTENIIKMAREAGIADAFMKVPHRGVITQLKRFAKLIRDEAVKVEREEIALEFEKRHEGVKHLNNYWLHAAKYVMARGSA